MKRVVNFRFAAFCALGAMCGAFFGRLATASVLACILLPLAVFAGGFVLSLVKKKAFAAILCLCFAVGSAATTIDFFTTDVRWFEGEVVVKGRVAEEEASGFTLENVTVDGEKISGKIYVKTKERASVGDKVKYKGRIKTYEDDPFDVYDALRYAEKAYYYTNEPTFSYITEGERTFFERIRYAVNEAMRDNLAQEDYGILKSLVFGDRSDLAKTDKKAMSSLGLSHIFAVSGLHVGFIAALILFLSRRLRVPRLAGAAVTLVAVLFYGVLTGFPVGVKRVGITLVAGYIAKLFAKKADPPTTLAVAGAVCVLFSPRSLFDVSFLMSFGACLGLICFYNPMYVALTKRIRVRFVGRWIKYLIGLPVATISANAFLLPLTMAVFHTVSPYTILGNLLVLPIVTVLFPYSAVAAFLTAAWSKCGVLLQGSAYGIYAVRYLSETLSSLPYATLYTQKMTAFCAATYYGTLLFVSPYVLVPARDKCRIGVLGGSAVAAMLFLV